MRRVVVSIALVFASAGPAAAQLPTKFTNLQILPKDATQAQVVATMKGFALGIGVRCEFCHVGEGNDLSKFDFASDEKAPKATARKMLRLLAAVNEQLADVGTGPAGPAKVTCFTCHRGAPKPATAPEGRGSGAGPSSTRR